MILRFFLTLSPCRKGLPLTRVLPRTAPVAARRKSRRLWLKRWATVRGQDQSGHDQSAAVRPDEFAVLSSDGSIDPGFRVIRADAFLRPAAAHCTSGFVGPVFFRIHKLFDFSPFFVQFGKVFAAQFLIDGKFLLG